MFAASYLKAFFFSPYPICPFLISLGLVSQVFFACLGLWVLSGYESVCPNFKIWKGVMQMVRCLIAYNATRLSLAKKKLEGLLIT